MSTSWDTIIVGAGPAGMAAASACPGKTLVIDHMGEAGRKLLITGGGRCNVTRETDADTIMAAFGRTGRFMRQALAFFGPADIRTLLEQHGVATVVEGRGYVFPASGKAADVRDGLQRAAGAAGAEFMFGCEVTGLVLDEGRVTGVSTDQGQLKAGRVVLAAGGSSYPATGSDGSGFRIAETAGLSIERPVPALTSLQVKQAWLADLAGSSLENARVMLTGKGADKQGVVGSILFTHNGISGPPVLSLSGEVAARLAAGETSVLLALSVVSDCKEDDWLRDFENWRLVAGSKEVSAQLAGKLTKRMARAFCEAKGLGDTVCSRMRREDGVRLARFLSAMPLTVIGTDGWDKAMITRGGVALKELDPATMLCRRVPGLHCAGEMVDLDGICGGYNLTWAIASGRLAGASVNPD